MSHRRLDIPFDRDGSGRFLPWLIALMVYLAALALAGMLALGVTLASWNAGLSGTLTIEVPQPQPPATGDGGIDAAVGVLRATPGVVSAVPLDRAATLKLVEPWLGPGLSSDDLDFPRLIDVQVASDRAVDLTALAAKLKAVAPTAVLDDHRMWLGQLARFAVSVEATALAIVALIGAAAVLTVIFTTRAGLSVHRDVIELLHLMGARDGYIASQFQRQALRLGLTGGLVGLALAVATLLGLGHAASATALLGNDAALLPSFHLRPWHWLALIGVPVAAAVIAMVTARLTVLRALARMP